MNETMTSPVSLEAEEREPERTWVSIDPADAAAERAAADEWWVFVNAASGESRRRILSFVLVTESAGWDALAEVDDALWSLGYLRTGGWQIGSGRGFVAFVSDMRGAER